MLVDRISRTNNSTDPAHRSFRLIAASTLGRQLTVEFIGTFILVLTVGLSTSTKGAGDLAPLGGKLSRRQTARYAVTQLATGALAALLVRAFVGPATLAVLGLTPSTAAGPPPRAAPLLLETRELGTWPDGHAGRRARLLGELRLRQPRRSMARAALPRRPTWQIGYEVRGTTHSVHQATDAKHRGRNRSLR